MRERPMTNEELADALKAITEPNYALGIGDIYRIHAAADALRAMPEGERIEGWTNAVDAARWPEIVLALGPERHVSRNTRATLTIHKRKDGDR